jgi:hypothetical protein
MGTAYADDIIRKLHAFQRSANALFDNVYTPPNFIIYFLIERFVELNLSLNFNRFFQVVWSPHKLLGR